MKPLTLGVILGLSLLPAAPWVPDATAGTIVIDFGAPQTLTTTTNQTNRLTKFVANDNAERATAGLPARTIEEYMKDVITPAVGSWIKGADDRDAVDACATYKTLTAPQKATITGLLLASPCP